MKKILLFFLCSAVATNIISKENSTAQSRWEKIKTVLISQKAKITYGVLGLVSSSIGLTYVYTKGKIYALYLDAFLDGRLAPGHYFYGYGLDYWNIDYPDKNRIWVITAGSEKLQQKKLQQIARDIKLGSWFTRERIKVTTMMKNNELEITIDLMNR